MLQFFTFGVLGLLLIIGMGLFIAIFTLVIEIVARIWPNYIIPWLNKHFGESDW